MMICFVGLFVPSIRKCNSRVFGHNFLVMVVTLGFNSWVMNMYFDYSELKPFPNIVYDNPKIK